MWSISVISVKRTIRIDDDDGPNMFAYAFVFYVCISKNTNSTIDSSSSKTTINDDSNNRMNVITCMSVENGEGSGGVGTMIADVFHWSCQNEYVFIVWHSHAWRWLLVSYCQQRWCRSFSAQIQLWHCVPQNIHTRYTHRLKAEKERRRRMKRWRESKIDKQNGKKWCQNKQTNSKFKRLEVFPSFFSSFMFGLQFGLKT